MCETVLWHVGSVGKARIMSDVRKIVDHSKMETSSLPNKIKASNVTIMLTALDV